MGICGFAEWCLIEYIVFSREVGRTNGLTPSYESKRFHKNLYDCALKHVKYTIPCLITEYKYPLYACQCSEFNSFREKGH